MKPVVFKLFTFFLFFQCCYAAFPQKPIVGHLLDKSSSKPLAYASIVLSIDGINECNTTMSDSTGYFSIENKNNCSYLIISFIGYETRKIEVNDSVQNMGNVFLTPIDVVLQEFIVSKPPKLIEISLDKTIYNASIDPLNQNKTAFDVLRNTPMVQINGNSILVNGLPVIILMNNKEYPFLNNNPAEYLKTESSSMIKSVEIKTLMTAKYGDKIIINLVAHKPLIDKYDGNIGVNASQKADLETNASFSFSKSKLTSRISASEAINQSSKNTSSGKTESYNFDQIRFSESESPKSTSQTYSAGYTGTYEPAVNHLFSSAVLFSGSRPVISSISKNITTEIRSDESIIRKYQSWIKDTNLNSDNFSAKADYQYTFKNDPGRLFTFSYDAHKTKNSKETDYEVNGLVNYADKKEERQSGYSSFDQTIQMDYVHPVKKTNQIDGGIKYILRRGTDDIRAGLLDGNIYSIIEDMTNHSRRNENVATAYFSFRYKLRNFLLDFGSRMEYSHIFYSDKSTDGFSNNYFKIVPNVSFAHQIKRKGNLTFGYSMDSYKPEIDRLNPTVIKTGEKSFRHGNPDLHPIKKHTFQLNYSQMFGMNLLTNNSISYTVSPNGINYYHRMSDDSIYYMSYANAENMKKLTFSTFENISFLNRKLQINAIFSPSYVLVTNNNTGEKTDGLEYFWNISASYSKNRKFSFIANASAMTNMILLQTNIRMSNFNHTFTISYTHSPQWSFSLFATNLFNPVRKTYVEMFGENLYSESTALSNQMRINMSARYQFGGMINIKESKRKIINNDMAPR